MNGTINQTSLDELYDQLISNRAPLRLEHPAGEKKQDELDAYFRRLVSTARALAVYKNFNGEGEFLDDFDRHNTSDSEIRDFMFEHDKTFTDLIERYEAETKTAD
ncbi:hypothetical protein [Spirosoma agri]|uniref:Uncharacterized protein n=1 Tax=Spirosoma agri TaxID=1987381 RepID=A0A6M0IGR4_9BACT|nr:hypothetical protein [Spirosoma agri]NEU67466.1 hypothetical protein [Spirosoma agri]